MEELQVLANDSIRHVRIQQRNPRLAPRVDRFELRKAQAATAAGSFFSHSSPQIITAWPGETSRYWRTGGT